MKKRLMEGGQLSKEQYEAQDDDDGEVEEAGQFVRASDAELATRKRFTLKKRDSNGGSSTPSISAGTSNPFAAAFSSSTTPAAPLANPFAATLLTVPNTTAAKPTAPAANPFANFTQLTAPTSVPSTATSLSSSSSVTSSASNVHAMATKPSLSDSNGNDNEYKKKMRKLNESFLRWAEKQVKENAVAIWKDGVKDYLKHQEALRVKFGASETTVTITTSTKEMTSFGTNDLSVANVNTVTSSGKPVFSLGVSSTTTTKVPPPTFSLGTNNSGGDSTSTSNPSAAPKPFTFGAPLASSAPAAAPASFSFNVPNSTVAPPASGGFNFSLPPTNSAATSIMGNTFAFKPPAPPVTALPSKTCGDEADEGGNGGDEEGEPILAPEKVLRNDQDTDIITLEVNCKLYSYNTTDKEWKDTGKGTLRITQDPATKKKRMVMRNGTGKIILNAAFFKTFKVERVKGGLKFSAFVANETTGEAHFKMFMTKLKDENSEKLKVEMEKAVSELQ